MNTSNVQIVLVGSAKGGCGYHVFRNSNLVFRMNLTLKQASEIDKGVLCGINTLNPPKTITIVNPFNTNKLYTTVETIEEAKLVLLEEFQAQSRMFYHD